MRSRALEGRDQRDETEIGACADALQQHLPETVGDLGGALDQGELARLLQARLGEIGKSEQRTRGLVAGGEHAVPAESNDRRLALFDDPRSEEHTSELQSHVNLV